MAKRDQVVEAVAVRPMSLGAGHHVSPGQRFTGVQSVVARLVGMGKARYLGKDETDVSEPEITAQRRTRRGQ